MIVETDDTPTVERRLIYKHAGPPNQLKTDQQLTAEQRQANQGGAPDAKSPTRDPLGPGRQMTPSNEFGRLISQKITSEADTFYHHYDALGSTVSLTDSSEVVTDEYDYEAFGDTAAESGATPNPYLWVAQVGYRKDEETGLYDLRRRNYSPTAGRFTSEDPVRSDEENLYRYVGNRAVQETDPSGLGKPIHEQILEKYKGSTSGFYEKNVAWDLHFAAVHRKLIYKDLAAIGHQWNALKAQHKPKTKAEANALAANDWYIAETLEKLAEDYDDYLENLDHAALKLARGFDARWSWSESELYDLYAEWARTPPRIVGLAPDRAQQQRSFSARAVLTKALKETVESAESTASRLETTITYLNWAQLFVATAIGVGGAYELKQEGQKQVVKHLAKYFGTMLLAEYVVIPAVQQGALAAGASEEEVYYGTIIVMMLATVHGGWRNHKNKLNQKRQNQQPSRTTSTPGSQANAPKGEGVVYKRTNPKTGETYVGQAKSPERFKARQGEHNRDLGVQHEYEVLGRAKPGKDLDVLEESMIRKHGGIKKEGGELANKRHQMREKRYREAGGTIDDPNR